MKALSDSAIRLLKRIEQEGGIYAGAGPGNHVSQLVALRNRGLVERGGMGGRWILTPAGREAIS